jgi:hypothetical protein
VLREIVLDVVGFSAIGRSKTRVDLERAAAAMIARE